MISPRFSHVLCSWIQNRRYRIQPDWWSLLLGVLGFFAFPSKTLEHYGSTKKSWRVTGFYRFFLSNSRSLSTVFIELDGNCMVDSVLSLSSRIIGFTGVVYGHVARWPRATLNGCFFSVIIWKRRENPPTASVVPLEVRRPNQNFPELPFINRPAPGSNVERNLSWHNGPSTWRVPLLFDAAYSV